MISKLVPREHIGKAFGVLAVIQAIVEGLSAEYYWIYTATSDWHPGFIYCLNSTITIVLILPISYILGQFPIYSIYSLSPNPSISCH